MSSAASCSCTKLVLVQRTEVFKFGFWVLYKNLPSNAKESTARDSTRLLTSHAPFRQLRSLGPRNRLLDRRLLMRLRVRLSGLGFCAYGSSAHSRTLRATHMSIPLLGEREALAMATTKPQLHALNPRTYRLTVWGSSRLIGFELHG